MEHQKHLKKKKKTSQSPREQQQQKQRHPKTTTTINTTTTYTQQSRQWPSQPPIHHDRRPNILDLNLSINTQHRVLLCNAVPGNSLM